VQGDAPGAKPPTKEEALAMIEAIKVSHPDNRAIKHFDRAYYDTLSEEDQESLLLVMRSGIMNPDSGMGCYAMQPADYDKFKPFFSKVGSAHCSPELCCLSFNLFPSRLSCQAVRFSPKHI
jgi:creatine kinase